MAGYSGTPLPKKLGIGEGSSVALIGAPAGVLDDLPAGVTVKRQARGKADVVVAFFVERAEFERRIGPLSTMIFPDGGLWVAWPKRASGLRHDHERTRGAGGGTAARPGGQQGLRHRRHLVGIARRLARRAPTLTSVLRTRPKRDNGQIRTSTLPTMRRFGHRAPVAAVTGLGPVVTHDVDVDPAGPRRDGGVSRAGRTGPG